MLTDKQAAWCRQHIPFFAETEGLGVNSPAQPKPTVPRVIADATATDEVKSLVAMFERIVPAGRIS